MAKIPQIISDLSGEVVPPKDVARIRVYIDNDDYVLDVSREEAIDIAVKGKKVKRRGKPAIK
jgi:hypothetical protein